MTRSRQVASPVSGIYLTDPETRRGGASSGSVWGKAVAPGGPADLRRGRPRTAESGTAWWGLARWAVPSKSGIEPGVIPGSTPHKAAAPCRRQPCGGQAANRRGSTRAGGRWCAASHELLRADRVGGPTGTPRSERQFHKHRRLVSARLSCWRDRPSGTMAAEPSRRPGLTRVRRGHRPDADGGSRVWEPSSRSRSTARSSRSTRAQGAAGRWA